jgi:hypothetical protein
MSEADYEMRLRRSQMRRESHEEVESILTLAGLRSERMWELANGYWPDSPTYDDVRYPWWLAKTSIGLIRIGRRKRVLAIDWEATGIKASVTDDEVTRGETMVHAWSSEKAVEYMKRLRVAADQRNVAASDKGEGGAG